MNGYSITDIGGMCPTQAWGNLEDGRAFYFRARGGAWTIDISDGKEDAEEWAGARGSLRIHGHDPTGGMMADKAVIKILDEYLS